MALKGFQNLSHYLLQKEAKYLYADKSHFQPHGTNFEVTTTCLNSKVIEGNLS